MSSVELYSAQFVQYGFAAEEVWLSTGVEHWTSAMKVNFALSPYGGVA